MTSKDAKLAKAAKKKKNKRKARCNDEAAEALEPSTLTREALEQGTLDDSDNEDDEATSSCSPGMESSKTSEERRDAKGKGRTEDTTLEADRKNTSSRKPRTTAHPLANNLAGPSASSTSSYQMTAETLIHGIEGLHLPSTSTTDKPTTRRTFSREELLRIPNKKLRSYRLLYLPFLLQVMNNKAQRPHSAPLLSLILEIAKEIMDNLDKIQTWEPQFAQMTLQELNPFSTQQSRFLIAHMDWKLWDTMYAGMSDEEIMTEMECVAVSMLWTGLRPVYVALAKDLDLEGI